MTSPSVWRDKDLRTEDKEYVVDQLRTDEWRQLLEQHKDKLKIKPEFRIHGDDGEN